MPKTRFSQNLYVAATQIKPSGRPGRRTIRGPAKPKAFDHG